MTTTTKTAKPVKATDNELAILKAVLGLAGGSIQKFIRHNAVYQDVRDLALQGRAFNGTMGGLIRKGYVQVKRDPKAQMRVTKIGLDAMEAATATPAPSSAE